MNEKMTGRIVSASFEDGDPGSFDCGLEDCECPIHEELPLPAGTYITIRLDEDYRIWLWDVEIEVKQ